MKHFTSVLFPYSILFRGMSVVHFPPFHLRSYYLTLGDPKFRNLLLESILELLRESFGCKVYKSS